MSGKRTNTFQGRPENPYDDRDEPADPPQRATAAQMAARKIKTAAKPRRPAGASSGFSQSFNLGGAQQPPSFSFGASAPIGGDNNGANASGGMFGGFGAGTTSSFPPAQPSNTNNNHAFTNSSFPAPNFGAGTQSTAFQPPAGGFDFTPASSITNPFGGLNGNAPAANGGSSTAFGDSSTPFGGSSTPFGGSSTPFGNSSAAFGGSLFGSQPTNNPFAGSQQNNTSSSSGSSSIFGTTNGGAQQNNTSSSSGSSSIFGTTNGGAQQNNTSSSSSSIGIFGATNGASTAKFQFGDASSSAAAAPSTQDPPSQPYSFGANTSGFATQSFGAATPAPAATTSSGLFGSVAATPPPAAATTSSSQFDFGPATPAPAAATTSSGLFGGFGSTTPAPASPAAATTSSGLFSGFGSTTPAPAAATPSSGLFGSVAATPASTAATTSSGLFGFSATAPASAAATPSSGLFGSVAATPAPAAAKASSNLFGFGAATPDTTEAATPKPAEPATGIAMFGGDSAPSQPAPATQSPNVFPPYVPNPSASFSGPTSTTPNMFEAPKAQPTTPTPAKATKPEVPTLNTAAAPQLPKIGRLGVPKDWVVEDITGPEDTEELIDHILQLSLQLQAMNQKFREMLNNTSPVADWSAVSIWHHQQTRTLMNKIDNAKKQRAAAKGVTGFESALSAKRKANEGQGEGEGLQESSKRSRPSESLAPELNKQVTPPASASTPNSATSDMFSKAIGEKRAAAPFGATNGTEAPKPAAASTGWAPSFEAPKASTPSTGFTPSFGAPKASTPSTGFTPSFGAPKASTPSTGFTPSFGTPKATSTGGFTPTFGGSSSGGNTDFMAAFAKNAKTYEELAAERKKKAKDADYDSDDETEEEWSARYDQEEADRLAKEKEAVASAGGFTLPGSVNASGTTTPTPASEPAKDVANDKPANLFANLAKPAAEDKPAASTTLFANLAKPAADKPATSTNLFANLAKPTTEDKPTASTNLFSNLAKPAADKPATSTNLFDNLAKPAAEDKPATPTNLFANFSKTTSGAPSMFRNSSPAPSTTGGRSVFDTPSAAPSPSGNLFGHLSSGPSSAHQDDTDGEDDQEEDDQEDKSQSDHAVGSTGSTSPKRKLDESETDSDATSGKKQVIGGKGSLLSRMTRADDVDSEAENENGQSTSVLTQSNGTSTPTNKPFAFFNFASAGANTAPPKNTFAGDQTFKAGSPIKFGEAPATDKKGGPFLQFQPATPSPADFSTTPSKPPPSLFSLGGPTGSSLFPPSFGASAPSSVPSSMFNSRAGTPLSETETNKDSGAEDEEEGEKQEQVDLSQLTEDEKASNDVVFHIDLALAKHQVDQGDGTKKWENFARGPLWILKDKVTGKCFVRIRIPSGATPLNYQILPALRSTVAGSSKKMVQATRPGKDKGLIPVYFAVKTTEVAEEFSRKYNESMPAT